MIDRFVTSLCCMLTVLGVCILAAAPTSAAQTGGGIGNLVGRVCSVSNNTSLRACADHAAAYDTIAFVSDVSSPPTAASCASGGGPAIALRNLSGKTIDGRGHTWRRAAPLTCPAILIQRSNDITIRNLSIIENPDVVDCALGQKQCPSTIDIETSKKIMLGGVRIFNGKGYVIRVWHTDGFTFDRSALADAGMIGLYIGHYKFGMSSNIAISNSVFAHSRTNGVAIEGADGVRITGSVFNNNHWHGLWPVAGVKNGITTGGQLLLADATNATVSGNVFSNGACGNCNPRRQTVLTIELGDPSKGAPGVQGLTITHNVVLNDAGIAFHENGGSHVDGVTISANRLRGDLGIDDIKEGASSTSNAVEKPTAPRRGATSDEAVRFQAGGTHQTADSVTGLTGGHVEAIFRLSPAPRPGASSAPILLCSAKDAGESSFVVAGTHCGAMGQPRALLGFPYEAGFPKAEPFFFCHVATRPADRFLSWNSRCEGQSVISALGFAVPGAVGK